MSPRNYNIEFSYLFRGAGNYKQFGSIIFSNPNNLTLENIDKKIRLSLIDAEYFYHDKVDIPQKFFQDQDDEDPTWHEYHEVSITEARPTDKRTIEEFISQLKPSRILKPV